jgi:hypothetical protein
MIVAGINAFYAEDALRMDEYDHQGKERILSAIFAAMFSVSVGG